MSDALRTELAMLEGERANLVERIDSLAAATPSIERDNLLEGLESSRDNLDARLDQIERELFGCRQRLPRPIQFQGVGGDRAGEALIYEDIPFAA